MGILDDANNKMHEMKGKLESTDMDDKAKLKLEQMRNKRMESDKQTDTTVD